MRAPRARAGHRGGRARAHAQGGGGAGATPPPRARARRRAHQPVVEAGDRQLARGRAEVVDQCAEEGVQLAQPRLAAAAERARGGAGARPRRVGGRGRRRQQALQRAWERGARRAAAVAAAPQSGPRGPRRPPPPARAPPARAPPPAPRTQVLPPDGVQRAQRVVQPLLRHQLARREALRKDAARGGERGRGA